MSSEGHHNLAKFLIVGLAVFCTAAPAGFAQDKGAPPWGEFLKRFKKDPLLKEPFHMSPEGEVKGLSSKIRARELDVPNRKRAIRYLKDLDCTQFPESKEMLLSLLDPEAEKWEEVRFEAAKGLRDMLARHSCNPDAGKNGKNGKDGKVPKDKSADCQSGNCEDSLWQQCCDSTATAKKRLRGERTKPQEPACHCTSCCDADTLSKLAKTAYEMKENGCCYEPSLRVREMAVEAIKACGVPCNYKPYYGEFDEEPGPPAWDEAGRNPNPNVEDTPPERKEEGLDPSPSDNSQNSDPAPVPAVTNVVTPISRLTNLCIVSLSNGQQVKPNPQISATHRRRIYYFASEAARQAFVENPERYAVAFGGCDPVQFVRTQQAVEGRFLAEHEGRFFMFASRENHEAFKANPGRYLPKTGEANRVASN